jgi:hypothetical protein
MRVLAILALVAVACGVRPLNARKSYPGPDRPRREVAFINYNDVAIRVVDGVELPDRAVGGPADVLVLAPGAHTLVIQAAIQTRVGQGVMTSLTDPFPFTIVVQAGGTYTTSVGLTGDAAAKVTLTDITDKIIVLEP